MNPYASTDPRLNAVRPVLELLVTLRQLSTLAPKLSLSAEQLAVLQTRLATVAGATSLSVQGAEQLRGELLASLSDTQQALLTAERNAQTARLRALLTRMRLAAIDGRSPVARYAYSQWLGSATVEALLSGGDSVMTSRVQVAALSTRQVLTRQYP